MRPEPCGLRHGEQCGHQVFVPFLAGWNSPSSFILGSFGHALIGHLYSFSTTLTKPASISRCLWEKAISVGEPYFLEASRLRVLHLSKAESLGMESSSDEMG